MWQPSWQWITRLFTLESPKSYKINSIILTVIIVMTSILVFNMGLPHMMTQPWDVMNLLEGGWRVVNGQKIFVDFISPPGGLPYLLTALGLKIGNPSSSAITYGTLISFLIITPWAWFIASSRLSSLNALLFSLLIGFLLISPHVLGDNPKLTTYAMLYNRQGFALLSLLFVELFIPHRILPNSKNILLSGISSGALLFLIWIGKINYFLFAIVAILVYVLLCGFTLRWLISLAVSFLISWLIAIVLFKYDLFAHISNILGLLPIVSGADRISRIKSNIFESWYILYLIFVLLIPIDSIIESKMNYIIGQKKLWAIVLFTIISGLIIVGGNTQSGDVPLFAVAGLIILENLRREFMLSGQNTNSALGFKYFLSTLIIVPMLCVSILFNDMASLAYSIGWHKFKLPNVAESQRFQSENLHDFIVPEEAYITQTYVDSTTKDYPIKINEGIKLLKKYVSNNSRIFNFSFTNAFPFALGLNYPTDVPLWWDLNVTFSKKHFPDPEKTFKNVDIVMIPKITDPELQKNKNMATIQMKEIYGDYLKTHFLERENTPFWILMTKR